MNFCSKCGFKLDGQDVCPKCGFSEGDDTKENDLNEEIYNNEGHKINNKKVMVMGTFLFILLIAVGCFVKNYYSNPNLVLNEFKDSITKKNLDKLEDTLYCEDTRLKLNDENVKIMMSYFEKNPSYLDEVMSSLNIQCNRIKEHNILSNTKEIFVIRKIGSKFLLFPDYRVCIHPGYINVKSKIKDVTININNKPYCRTDSNEFKKEIGPLMPGNYKLTCEFANKFIKKTSNKNIDLVRDNLKTVEEEIMPDLKYITIDSDIKNARVYNNGKDSGITVAEASKFGPVDASCIIYAVDNSSGKTFKTEGVKVLDSDNIYLSFSNAIQQENDFNNSLYTLVNSYASDFAYAVNYDNFSCIEGYLEPNSSIYNMQKKVVSEIHNSNITEDFLGLEILNYNFDKDKNQGRVTTKEMYDITRGYGNTKTQDFKNTYSFIRRPDGRLMLTSISD